MVSQQSNVLRIGIIRWNTHSEFDSNVRGFKDGLAENGFLEGENVIYIDKASGTDIHKHFEISRDFVNNKDLDLIYATTTPGTLIVKSVTDSIPIVFTIVTYPTESKVINSLENSGNNLVGTRNYVEPSKQFALFEQILPNITSLGFAHRRGEPNSDIQLREFTDLLRPRGIKVVDLAATSLDELLENFQLHKDHIDSVFLACDTLVSSYGDAELIRINREMNYGKKFFACNPDGVANGAIAGNVANWYEIGKISGEKAALILHGAHPSWLRTESPRRESISINLKAAQEQGVDIPDQVIKLADVIIN